MKRLTSLILFSFTLLVTPVFSSCDGSGLEDIFLPNISNLWQSTRSSTFFFSDYTDNVSESSFKGKEEDGVIAARNFTGKFKNYDVELTYINGPENNVKFTGQFVKGSNPLQMKFTGTNGVNLTLTRQP
jgi:hypothetical protein